MKVAVLTIWDSNAADSTISLHTDSSGAFRMLVNWVEGMWDEELLGCSFDDASFGNNADMVDYFFDRLNDEYQYDIQGKNLYGPRLTTVEPDPDVVELSPAELHTMVHAVANLPVGEIAQVLNTSQQIAYKVAQDVLKKLE